MDDVLLRTSPEYKEFRQEILRAIHLLDTSIAAHRPTIVTESYLTGEEVMELFSLCPRTLQNYRESGTSLHDDRQQNPLPAFSDRKDSGPKLS